ncbi:MAG TPA: hypothetical protein PLH29_03305 [bacterium]|nr:hypothetical protein [bacterium]
MKKIKKIIPDKAMAILVIVFALSMLISGAWYVYADWRAIPTAVVSGPLTADAWNAMKHNLDGLANISSYSVSVRYTADNSRCSPQAVNMGEHTVCFLTGYRHTTVDGVVHGRPDGGACEVTRSGSNWILTATWKHWQYGDLCPYEYAAWAAQGYVMGTYCTAMCLH